MLALATQREATGDSQHVQRDANANVSDRNYIPLSWLAFGPRGFLDTNILVLVMQTGHVGGLNHFRFRKNRGNSDDNLIKK